MEQVDNAIQIPPSEYIEDSDDGWMGNAIGTKLQNVAAVYMLSGEEKYLQAAEQIALAACSYPTWGRGNEENASLMAGHILAGLGYFYDWCYEDISQETRDTVRNTIIERGNIIYEAAQNPSTFWAQEWLQNHMFIKVGGMVIAGMAIVDEYEGAEKWFQQANKMFANTMKYLADDGANQEGAMYWLYGMQYTLCYMDLVRDFYHVDYYQTEWFRNTAFYLIYLMFPEEYWTPQFNHFNLADDEYSFEGGTGPDHFIFKLAKEFQDGHAQYFAEKIFEKRAHKPTMLWPFILWNDQDVEPLSPDTLPKLHYFDDMEIVSARSDWKNNESMLLFKCGPYMGHKALLANTTNPIVDWGGGHAHPDAAHFSLFAEGDMQLVDDGYSHKYTNSHNSLLIDGKGQLGEGYVWFKYQDAQSVFSNPRIRKVESTECYDYMVGEAKEAYSASTGLIKFDRHLLFLKPNVLIVVDDIAAEEARDFELRFFPYTQTATEQGDGTYYLQNSNSKLLVNPVVKGGEFTAEEVTLYSGKDNTKSTTPTSSSQHLAFRATKNEATEFVNAVAFSWSGNHTIPVSVIGKQSGSKFEFEVMGEKYTLDIASDKVTAPEPAKDMVQVLHNGTVIGSGLDVYTDKELKKTYLPVRDYISMMGGTVTWIDETQTAQVSFQGMENSFREGQDGVLLRDDRMYLATEQLEGSFQLNLYYNGNSNKVLSEDAKTDPELKEMKLDVITIDNKAVKNYDPDVKEYEIVNTWGQGEPVINAVPQTMSAVYRTSYTEGEKIVVTVQSRDGTLSTDYVFHIKPYLGMGDIVVENILESDTAPEKAMGSAMDGDYTTNSTSEGDNKWAVFDFGKETNLAAVGIAPYIGNTRQAKFDILCSKDGENYTEIYSGGSSGTTAELEYYDMKNTAARYVKLLCHGNTTNMKNSFNEICFFSSNQFAKELTIQADKTQLKVGESVPFTVSGCLMDGGELDLENGTLELTSSSPEVAELQDNRIVAKSNGETIIKAVYALEGISKTAELTVSVSDGTYLKEDFETYRDGGALDSPWSKAGTDQNNGSSVISLDGSNVLKITGNTPNFYPNVTYPLNKSGKIVFEGDIMSDSTNGYKRIQLYDSKGALYSPLLQMNKDGDMVAYDVDKEYTLRTYRKNQWYHYKIVMDLAAERYDVYIDGRLYGNQLGMRSAEGTGARYQWDKGIKSLRLDVSAPDGDPINFYLDNLMIYEYNGSE